MDYQDSNNKAELIGVVESTPVVNHEIYGEVFYLFTLKVPRLSGNSDSIRIIASERLLSDFYIDEGDMVKITGQFRSYNLCEGGTSRLILSVFAQDITTYDDNCSENPNRLYLNGYICKTPVYRTTPFGREICDILLAVNRTYNKSDYIPIISWGRNARFSGKLNVGDNIKVWGRIQSRKYQKHLSDDEVVEKTAFEVSVCRMEKEENTICS